MLLPSLFNMAVIRPGDILIWNSETVFSSAIRRACHSKWSHDAIVVRHNGVLCAGDSRWGMRAAANPLSTWEEDCREQVATIGVLRVPRSSPYHGEAAADWWLQHVMGTRYDAWAIVQLGLLSLKAAWGDSARWPVGMESRFFCTEGCRDAWLHGVGLNPWSPKVNVTPGTTTKRLMSCDFADMGGTALTAEGQKYRIVDL